MKNLLVMALMLGVFIFVGCSTTSSTKPLKRTYSSFDQPSDHLQQAPLPAGTINFKNVSLEQVLEIYTKCSGRTVLRGTLPSVNINLRSAAPISQIQFLQMMDTVLAQNGIAMVLSGEDAVKVVTTSQAIAAVPPEIDLPWQLLPESSSVMTRTVHFKKSKPSQVLPMLMPFAGLPNSMVVFDNEQLLILRDYSANIRQQLRMLEELDRKPSP